MSQPPGSLSQRSAHSADVKTVERQLREFSRRIDWRLRKHFATRRLSALLQPLRSESERGQTVSFYLPSRWSIATFVVILVLGFGMAGSPLSDKASWISYWPVIVALITAWIVEYWLGPQLALSRYAFRLMRLELLTEDAQFPHLYTVAPVTDSESGFANQSWRAVSGIEPGDIVISISRGRDLGLAIIPLRTEGKLPVVVWMRDLYQEKVLPSLGEQIKQLALSFDESCDTYREHGQRIERSRVLRSNKAQPLKRDPELAWRDVSINAAVKQQLIKLAEDFAQGGLTASRGLLLYGPPGTGKTLIAKTLADSLGCAFYPLSLPDLKSGYVGQSGERVKAIWDKALAEPRAVIFIDECESVFARRGGAETDKFVEDIVNAFIARWDGFSRQSSVWVIGATNRRDLLDPAVLSRFDELVEIGLPNGELRQSILHRELTLLGCEMDLPEQTALLTQGFSGRDLSALARRLARENRDSHTIDQAMLAHYCGSLRKQGSTHTDMQASWDTLILPQATMKELKSTAGLLRNADTFTQRGISVPRGLLLYGPPGTGKTQIARTLANETGLRFIAASTAQIKQGYIGQSGQKVRELFERAREAAPCLLFIDEIDILASSRGQQGDMMTQEIIGQLLQEMDGVAAHPQHVFVLAATNRLDQIDPAIISRLPKRIEIGLPDLSAIEAILQVLLANKPLAFDLRNHAKTLAVQMKGRSGRDLRSWVEAAELNAVSRAIEHGDPQAVAIELGDFPTKV